MAETNGADAFFAADGEQLVPSADASSPWSPDMMHGRLFGGLLARALEREQAEPEFHFARLTVDLFRNTKLEPVRVETRRVRDGRRIRVADATVFAGENPVARASAVLLRRGDQPTGTVPATKPWDAPTPDELGPSRVRSNGWLPPFDVWLVNAEGELTDDWRANGQRRSWVRDDHELVAGESMSPFVRVALAGDFASPLANYGEKGLEFINADYTLTLSRLPLSEAIGMESTGHVNEDGIAVAQCTVHDTSGPIGFCSATAVCNPAVQQ
ncbi:thioesterase family protein [Saccharopolyspora sp. K220]|uniref:acyl-CoA thioesterase domain-containing protein n=1 Tax=Saccharopolyspora soli TaxID=2926618 RepID=UPI001F57D52A|nr:acyl-CoA thioesterase domain-containing protein [Saccharopolyspora soli]MCI2418827.1 thioesterase family protein [Saccharopolyspora soli]